MYKTTVGAVVCLLTFAAQAAPKIPVPLEGIRPTIVDRTGTPIAVDRTSFTLVLDLEAVYGIRQTEADALASERDMSAFDHIRQRARSVFGDDPQCDLLGLGCEEAKTDEPAVDPLVELVNDSSWVMELQDYGDTEQLRQAAHSAWESGQKWFALTDDPMELAALPQLHRDAGSTRIWRALDIRFVRERYSPQGSCLGTIIGRAPLQDESRWILTQMEWDLQNLVQPDRADTATLQWGLDRHHVAWTTLDAPVSCVTYHALKRGLKRSLGLAAQAVVVDIPTSSVIASVSVPGWSLNSGESTDFQVNRPMDSALEPASTMKPFLYLSALESKVTKPSDQFHHTSHKPSEPEFISLRKALQISSQDVAIALAERIYGDAEVGERRGAPFTDLLLKAGICSQEHIRGRAKCSLPSTGSTKREFVRLSYGHGKLIPLVHLVNAYAALARKGCYKALAPILLGLDASTTSRSKGAPIPAQPCLSHIASEDNVETVTRWMRSVVIGGTGDRADLPGFEIAAKTGTVQIAVAEDGDEDDRYLSEKLIRRHCNIEPPAGKRVPKHIQHVLIAGFFPVHQPRFAVAIAVECVPASTVSDAQLVAGPIFRDISKALVARYGLVPTFSVASAEQ